MKIFLAPHCDDECLYGAYTIMRYKPLVVVMNVIEEATDNRKKESIEAMKILEAEIKFLTEEEVKQLKGVEVVFAPAIDGGHLYHDHIAMFADDIFKNVKVIHYSTYRKYQGDLSHLQPKGIIRVESDDLMKEKKLLALKCYKSQLDTPNFRIKNKDEYYT